MIQFPYKMTLMTPESVENSQSYTWFFFKTVSFLKHMAVLFKLLWLCFGGPKNKLRSGLSFDERRKQ
jgi:hypothetical protein